jgi:predicted metalloprotease
VTARARLSLALAAVAALLIAAQARPQAAHEPFPQRVAVPAAPVPRLYDDAPNLRVLQLLASMNAMWDRTFAAAGDGYERPRVATRAGEGGSGCGSGHANWAGIYCPSGQRIVIDLGDHLVLRAALGDDHADDLLGYVLAHEVGHHVQGLRGVGLGGRQDAVRRAELHAQCLAGVWGRAAGRPLPAAESYAADADHGTVAEQRRWLERGHARGRPADCDGVFAGG